MNSELIGRQAVVVGASIGGLLGAAVLARHFERVVVLDGDCMDGASGKVRKATPQANHVHGLLSSGWSAMQQILPKLENRLRAQGVQWLHFGKELRWHHWGANKAAFDEPMYGPFMSRACLESCLRAEVGELSNVCLREDCAVESLTGGAKRVEGVITKAGETMVADLLLDASGRRGMLLGSLEALGVERPRKETLNAGVRYCSCRFRPDPREPVDWKALFIVPKPPAKRSGAIFPMENGDWLVTLMSSEGDTMPSTHQEFMTFAESLESNDLFQAIRKIKPISSHSYYRYKESRRLFYEERAMPKNLYAIGDAVCSFNPVFGQGMTVCALEAKMLGDLLGKGQLDAERYFKSISPLVTQAWEMITVEDMRHEEFAKQRSVKIKCMQALTARVYEKASTDAVLNRLLYEVIHFTRPATDLCKPAALLRLL